MKRRNWKSPSAELTLVAFTQDGEGLKSIVDIVTTSRHFASHFARKWFKDPTITEIAAMPPRERLHNSELYARTIYR